MKLKHFMSLSAYSVKEILFKTHKPILGTVILTDKCNLQCKHCAVNNITGELYPYVQIRQEMQMLYDSGVRILFFCGGETFLWEDGDLRVRDLVIEARKMGFLIINIVTNGTYPMDVPEADLILVSMDGDRECHNAIRGDSYDRIIKNIEEATKDNILLYMAVNQLNKDRVRDVCELAAAQKNVKAISYNFHTPYQGTEALSLSVEEKTSICNTLSRLMDDGLPVFNLRSAFPYIINNRFKTPCHQCVVIEKGKVWTCGRCIDEPGLCDQCGYFFAAEYALIFRGNVRVITDMLLTYLKYI